MVDNKQKHVAQRRRGGRADLRPIDVDEDVTEKRKSKSLNANLGTASEIQFLFRGNATRKKHR